MPCLPRTRTADLPARYWHGASSITQRPAHGPCTRLTRARDIKAWVSKKNHPLPVVLLHAARDKAGEGQKGPERGEVLRLHRRSVVQPHREPVNAAVRFHQAAPG